MRIAAMAAGAVGGYFGARMPAAGHDVFFIARGANLEAIKNNGLKIESVHGDVHLPKAERHRRSEKRRPGRHRAVRRQALGHREGRRATRPLVGRHARHHLAERRRQRRAHGADPRRRADHRRRCLYRHRDRRARRHQAHQRFRHDALRPRRQAPGRKAAGLRRCRQSGQDRHRHLRRYRARALAEIHLPHRHGRLDRRRLRSPIGVDPRRPRRARLFPQTDGGSVRGRPRQGRRARTRLCRRAHGLRR